MADDDAIATVCALDDPVRRAMYRFVRAAGAPVTRDDVASGTGASRKLAAFHLDKLVERGLLVAGFRPSAGGPAGGRPAKVYEPAPGEVSVTLPERRYDLVGEVLVDAVAAGGAAAERAARAAAREQGRRLAAAVPRTGRASRRRAVATARAVLDELGYEPREQGRDVVLGNCPFHALAARDPALVCGLNLDLVEGVLEGAGGDPAAAALDPGEGRCCVVLRATAARGA